MKINKWISVCLLAGFAGWSSIYGQHSAILDQYIQEAFADNRDLQQQALILQEQQKAVQEAQGLWKPTVNFGLNYTLAAGGRSISFPVGDLLNPVYSTLNNITQTNQFPQLENVEEQFLPNNFYDARVRITQPILNPDIKYNKAIKEKQLAIPEVQQSVIRRQLVRDIKMAYFQYLQAAEAVGIFENALQLLAENTRVNESLVRNGAAIPGVLVRIQGETSNVEGQLTLAKSQLENAAGYFNFLLRRPYDAPILRDTTLPELPGTMTAPALVREEVQQLDKALDIQEMVLEYQQTFRQPKLGVQLDLGSQGFNFNWGGYGLMGLSLEVPLYAGKRNLMKIDQTNLAIQRLRTQQQQVQEQIQLQVNIAETKLKGSLGAFEQYSYQINAADRFYRDVQRRYREGQAGYIEVLDGRTQLTNAKIQQSLARLQVWTQWVEWEFAVAAYPVAAE